MSTTPTVVQQLVTPVPNLAGTVKPQGTDLTAAQQRTYDAVLAHFSAADYELPGVNDGDAKLAEEERFWLVRDPPCHVPEASFVVLTGADRRTSAC